MGYILSSEETQKQKVGVSVTLIWAVGKIYLVINFKYAVKINTVMHYGANLKKKKIISQLCNW